MFRLQLADESFWLKTVPVSWWFVLNADLWFLEDGGLQARLAIFNLERYALAMSFPPAILAPAVVSRLRSALPALRREFPLKKLGVFGSTARGDAGPESDIDILVEVDPSIGLGFVTLAEQLEAELGRKVDLVSRRQRSRHFPDTSGIAESCPAPPFWR